MAASKLFEPIRVGDMLLKHRVVMAPLTRFRADDQHVPLPHVAEYYSQRASTPGTLLISEATYIAQRAGGYPNAPGIWSDAQISAWRQVTDAVHAHGSFMYLQLWALGRVATPQQLWSEDATFPFIAPSDVPMRDRDDGISPRPLTIAEIDEYIQLYVTAASNAVHLAGFDGVEVHGGNGYLVDQFLQDVSNKRTDAYGGSPEKRTRFALEVVYAVAQRVGERKTAIRLSPWNHYQDMLMEDPKPTFSHLISELRIRHPNLAYIHVVEPLIDPKTVLARPINLAGIVKIPPGHYNDFIRALWGSGDGEDDTRLISCGGHTRDLAFQFADARGDLLAFGRKFLANPDLPYRLAKDIPVTIGDKRWYYQFGSMDPKGYTDYPFAGQEEEVVTETEAKL